TPPRLTLALTGESIHAGKLRHNTPAIVAENALEAEKYAAAVRATQGLFETVARDTPEGLWHPVAVKAEELYGRSLPEPVREIVELYRSGATLDQRQTSALGLFWDAARQRVFPEDLTAEAYYAASPDELARFEGVRWVE